MEALKIHRVQKKKKKSIFSCDTLIPFILKTPLSSPSELWNDVFFLLVSQFDYVGNKQPDGFILDFA